MYREHRRFRPDSSRDRQLHGSARRVSAAHAALSAPVGTDILAFAERVAAFEDAWDRLLEALSA